MAILIQITAHGAPLVVILIHKMKDNKNRGFTLIELMVVISIISFLSSIVFSSLSNARAKAKDAAIIAGIKQFEILLNLEYNENKSYANLQPNLWYSTNGCSFSGNYAVKAAAICNKILTDASPWNLAGNRLFLGNGTSLSQSYSIMVALNSSNTYYCIGSSGRNSSTETATSNPTQWDDPGCYWVP